MKTRAPFRDAETRSFKARRLGEEENFLQGLLQDYLDLYSAMLGLKAGGGRVQGRLAAESAASRTLELARLYQSKGRLDEALELFSRAVVADIRPFDGGMGRMSVHLSKRELNRAFREGEALLDAGLPTGAQIEALSYPFGEKGRSASQKSGLRRLLVELDGSAAKTAGASWAALYRVTLSTTLGRTAADGDLRALSDAARGRYAWMRWVLGSFALARGRWEDASRDLSEVLRFQPRFLRAGFLLGEALLGLGRTAEALEVFRRFEPPESREKGTWLSWMGEIHLRLGRDSEALPYLEQACERGDGSPRSHCWRGAIRLRSGRMKEAVSDFTESIRIDPTDEEPFIWRAEAFDRIGETERAILDLASVLERRPGHLGALAMRARMLGRRGDLAGMRRDAAAVWSGFGAPPAADPARASERRLLRWLDELLAREGDRLKAAPNFYAAKQKTSWKAVVERNGNGKRTLRTA